MYSKVYIKTKHMWIKLEYFFFLPTLCYGIIALILPSTVLSLFSHFPSFSRPFKNCGTRNPQWATSEFSAACVMCLYLITSAGSLIRRQYNASSRDMTVKGWKCCDPTTNRCIYQKMLCSTRHRLGGHQKGYGRKAATETWWVIRRYTIQSSSRRIIHTLPFL